MNNEEINNDDSIANVMDPLVLEIFLFKNNYKDRLLISALKEKAHVVKIDNLDDNSFFVRVEDVNLILHDNFKKDIRDFDSTPAQSLSSSVTSIYFIDMMIQSFSKLKYFKVNVSNSEVYTRKSNNIIQFDYRVIHSKLDLTAFCTEEFLNVCKEIFTAIGVYKKTPFDNAPYFEIQAQELIDRLSDFAADYEEDSEEAGYITNLFSILGPKIEKDNPLILIVIEP